MSNAKAKQVRLLRPLTIEQFKNQVKFDAEVRMMHADRAAQGALQKQQRPTYFIEPQEEWFLEEGPSARLNSLPLLLLDWLFRLTETLEVKSPRMFVESTYMMSTSHPCMDIGSGEIFTVSADYRGGSGRVDVRCAHWRADLDFSHARVFTLNDKFLIAHYSRIYEEEAPKEPLNRSTFVKLGPWYCRSERKFIEYDTPKSPDVSTPLCDRYHDDQQQV